MVISINGAKNSSKDYELKVFPEYLLKLHCLPVIYGQQHNEELAVWSCALFKKNEYKN